QPLETWEWDAEGLSSQTTFVYDAAGRILEKRFDERPGPGPLNAPPEPGPDGDADWVSSVTYGAATAEATFTDLFSNRILARSSYALDDAGRPLVIDESEEDRLGHQVQAFEYADDGRVLSVIRRDIVPPSTHEERSDFEYGADGRPTSMRMSM